jgi:hypothetical protein
LFEITKEKLHVARPAVLFFNGYDYNSCKKTAAVHQTPAIPFTWQIAKGTHCMNEFLAHTTIL